MFDSEHSFGTCSDGHGQLLDAHATRSACLSDTVAYIHDRSLLRRVTNDKSSMTVVSAEGSRNNQEMSSTFAERIEKILTTLDLTHDQFGELVGVKNRAVGRWVNEGMTPKGMDTLLKIAEVAGCSIEWLMTGEGRSGISRPEIKGKWATAARVYKASLLGEDTSEPVFAELLNVQWSGKRAPTEREVHAKRQEIERSLKGESRTERDATSSVLQSVMERMKLPEAARAKLLSMAASRGDLSEAEWTREAEKLLPKTAKPKIRRR